MRVCCAAGAIVLLTSVWLAGAALGDLSTDPMFAGDPIDPATGFPYELLPGVPRIDPGPDGKLGSADDLLDPTIVGDVDLVLRTGARDGLPGADPIGPPSAALGIAPLGTAEPFGAAVAVPFVVVASDGTPEPAWGAPVTETTLNGGSVLIAAFPDLDGDGFVGITLLDGDELDVEIEKEELIPVGAGFAQAEAGRAEGEVAVGAGGTAGFPLRVLVAASAYAGERRPDFLNGVVPDGPAVFTALPFHPVTDPFDIIQGVPNPDPLVPDKLLGVDIEPAFEPDPTTPTNSEFFTIATDGSSPTVDAADVVSGTFARFGLVEAVRLAFYRAMPGRPLRPGEDDGGARALYEVLHQLVLEDDGAESRRTLRVVPLDRLGNLSDLPGPTPVQVRAEGSVRIIDPVSGGPVSELLLAVGSGGASFEVDDLGGRFDDPDRGTLFVRSGTSTNVLEVFLPDPDVDDSGVVDRVDVSLVKSRQGEEIGDAGYDPRLDLDGDGRIHNDDWRAVRRLRGLVVSGP